MEPIAVNDSVIPHMELKTSQTMVTEENEIKADEAHLQPLCEGSTLANELSRKKVMGMESLDKGYFQHGCSHYRRRCRIRTPCCNEIFDCRHCHNEAKNDIGIDHKLRHDVPRHQIEKVICSLCDTEQEARQICISCGVCMARYYCGICKVFDDDTSKEQYHCSGCGICRTGAYENFSHCDKCGCCFPKNSGHPCVERTLHHNCPVCLEYLFESKIEVVAMLCGHTIHKNCLIQMHEHSQYVCPICSKSACDMSNVWEKYDQAVAATPMPACFQDKKVWIHCNDCGSNSKVAYHMLGFKCPSCKSYNTRLTSGIGT